MMADPAAARAAGRDRRLARLRAMVVGGDPSTATVAFPAARTWPVGPSSWRLALALVDAGTTELAEGLLTVPLAYYRDPEQPAAERDVLLGGPRWPWSSRPVPGPHDFVVRDVLGTSVLFSRDADGIARAFLNYCRHRGAKPAGAAECPAVRLPVPRLDVRQRGPTGRTARERRVRRLDRDEYGLVALPSEERHGFVWVVLTAGPTIDVRAISAPSTPSSPVGAWTSEYLTEREFEAEVNWKAAIEAFAEDYHFPYVHATASSARTPWRTPRIHDSYGPHHRLGFPTSGSPRPPGSRRSRPPGRHGPHLLDLSESHPGREPGGRRDHRHPPGRRARRARSPRLDGPRTGARRGHPGGLRRSLRGGPRRRARRGLRHAPGCGAAIRTASTTTC